MKELFFLWLFLAFVCHTIFAQELKKEITKSELENLIDEIESPMQVGFNINIKEVYLTGDYPKNKEEIEMKKKEVESQLNESPENIDVLIQMANFYEEEEKLKYLQKAIEILEQEMEGREINGNDHLKLAKIFFANGDFGQSFESYQKASEMIPDSSVVWVMLASFSYSNSDVEEARKLSEKALKIDIENIDAQILYFHGFLMEGLMEFMSTGVSDVQFDYTYLDKVIHQFPENNQYKVLRNSFELMIIFYDIVIIGSNNLEEDDDYDKIFTPDKVQSVRLKELEKYFKEALQKEYVDKIFLYEMLGAIYLMQNQKKKALEYLEKIIKLDKFTPERFYNVVFIYGLQENWAEIPPVIQMKEELTAFDYALLGYAEYMQDNLNEALEKYEQGINKFKFSESALLLRLKGQAQYELGNLEDASKNLQSAFVIEPQNASIAYLLALVALQQENWTDAYNYLQKAEDLGNESAKEIKERYFE